MTLFQLPLDIRNKAKDGMLQGVPDGTYDSAATGQTLLNYVVVTILNLALVIGALLAFGFLIAGAVEWISAGGDKSKIEKAREKITGSIVGLIVLSSVVAVFVFIQNFLGINVLPITSTYTAPPNIPQTATCYDYSSRATCVAAGCSWSLSGCRP